MEKYIYAFCLLLVESLVVFAQSEDSSSSSTEPNTSSTPVASLFSNLGDLVLDIDEAIYGLSAPKEDSKVKQDETKSDLRMRYFNRIRENYEDLQKRIRQSLDASAEVLQNSNFMNLNFQNKGHKAFLDLTSPLLSMNVKVKAKSPKDEETTKTDKGTSEFPALELPFSDVSGTINIGGSNLNLRDNKNVEDSTAKIETSPKPDEIQKRSSRREKQGDKKRYSYQNYHPESKSFDDYPSDIYDEETDMDKQFETSTSDVQGRILGDLLFSESTFDKYFRRVLKDHGQWMLNPTVFPPKTVVENIRGITRDTFKDGETLSGQWKGNSAKVSSKSRQDLKSNKYVTNDRDAWQGTYPPSISGSRYQHGLKTILAFTPEGVPLKLKVDHRISDPLNFLHRRLGAAKVSLNIPVNSNIQPVGNDILQLGSVYGGMQSNALYLDLSNENQLNSLLRTLKKFRN